MLEEKLEKMNFIQTKEADIYHIEASQSSMNAALNTSYEVLIRGAQAIRELTGWADPVDITTTKAYLVGNHSVDISIDESMEVKKDRTPEDDEAKELVSKKKPPNDRGAAPTGKSLVNCTCQKEEPRPSLFHPGGTSLVKEK